MWSLSCGDTLQSLAAWGISGLTRRRSSQATDVVSFSMPGTAFDADLLIASGVEIRIYRDSVQWFVGRVTAIRRTVTGQQEGLLYEVSGPWWYLQRSVYQQVWNLRGGEIRQGHCILNKFADGTAMTTDEQLDEALDWAADRAEEQYGARPFQWDPAGFPSVEIPIDEVRDITCAEVVAKQLRWVPDAVAWWDYSTTPPTLQIKRRADLTEDTLSLAKATQLEVQSRDDLLVPAVVLKFERIDNVNGINYPSVSTDAWPAEATGEEFGALVSTIDLQGLTATIASTTIQTEALPTTESGWITWLKAKEPWLRNSAITIAELRSVSRAATDETRPDVYDYELVSGQIAPWMEHSGQQETVLATVRLTVALPDTSQSADEVRQIAINIQTTTATSGTYESVTSSVDGETPPLGLAHVLYDALSVLEYEGSCVITRAELDADATAVTLGSKINLTGLRSEWATMAAPIQEAIDSVDLGTTTLRFGPPQHLGPRDLVELLRINRFRFVYTAPSARSGSSVSASTVQLGRDVVRENASDGGLTRARWVVSDHAGGAGRIVLDATHTLGKELRAREISVCANGVEQRMLVVCSEPYTP